MSSNRPFRGILAHCFCDCCFFLSPDGTETWNVFHAENQHTQGSCGNDRYTMAERVYFNGTDDMPIFEQAQDLSTVQQAPSGESNSNDTIANQRATPSGTSTAKQNTSSIPTPSSSSPSKQNVATISRKGYSTRHLIESSIIVVLVVSIAIS